MWKATQYVNNYHVFQILRRILSSITAYFIVTQALYCVAMICGIVALGGYVTWMIAVSNTRIAQGFRIANGFAVLTGTTFKLFSL